MGHHLGTIPALGLHPVEFASVCTSCPCSWFRSGWSRAPYRRSPWRTAHQRPRWARWRCCAAAGDSPIHPSSLDLFGRPRLGHTGSVYDRSTVGCGLGPQCRVSARPRTRGAPHHSRAATWLPNQSAMPSTMSHRTFCRLAPRFPENQPAVQFSSNELFFSPVFIHFRPYSFRK